jgi:hypothetical protein
MLAIGIVIATLGLSPGLGLAAEELTLIATVTRVVNVPMIVGLRLLERNDGIKVTIKDLRSPEAAMLAVIEGQGPVGTGFAPFYPAVEKGAPVKGVMELSRPEFVVMAKKEIATVKGLNGVRLASHSPKATVQSLLEFYLKSQPDVHPSVVFIPRGLARARRGPPARRRRRGGLRRDRRPGGERARAGQVPHPDRLHGPAGVVQLAHRQPGPGQEEARDRAEAGATDPRVVPSGRARSQVLGARARQHAQGDR